MSDRKVGREKRVFQRYEIESIIEHVTLHRLKLDMPLAEVKKFSDELRETAINGNDIQKLINQHYKEKSLRKSLLRHLAKSGDSKVESEFATISVRRNVKKRFMDLKLSTEFEGEVSDWVSDLLDNYEKNRNA